MLSHMADMKITFLGTGTSQGVPVISCKCSACTSKDPKDSRLRTSAFVETQNNKILIDVGPDFRQQMLTSKINSLDAVILTHEHNDHIIGADDLRPFNFIQRRDMPIYGETRVLNEIKERFKYAFEPHPYPGIPRFKLIEITEEHSFSVGKDIINPVRIMHGSLPILGFRVKNFCYLTDVKTIPGSEFSKLENLDVVVLNALRVQDHHSHLTIREACDLAEKINAEKTYLTHFSHDLGPVDEWEKSLPEGVFAAYDGLQIEL